MMTEEQLVSYVRMLMRDKGEKNFLLNYQNHFSNQEIVTAAELAVMQYNAKMPPGRVSSWQQAEPYLVILGALKHLLASESFLQLRNQASMTTDDMELVGLDDKWAQYLQLKSDVAAEWDQLATGLKTSRNAESVYRSIPSGYRNIGRYYS